MGIVGTFESSGTWGTGFGGHGLALRVIRRGMRRPRRERCHDAWGSSNPQECQQPVHSLCRSSGPQYWVRKSAVSLN